MSEPMVVTFFYGSYLNLEVLAEVDIAPERVEVARLMGFDIVIRPLANLVPSDRTCVYGIIATCSHSELERLYRHAEEVLGGIYLPQAVLAHNLKGQVEPALCYIAPQLPSVPASAEYVRRIVDPAREYGFPDWYVEHVASFSPDEE